MRPKAAENMSFFQQISHRTLSKIVGDIDKILGFLKTYLHATETVLYCIGLGYLGRCNVNLCKSALGSHRTDQRTFPR